MDCRCNFIYLSNPLEGLGAQLGRRYRTIQLKYTLLPARILQGRKLVCNQATGEWMSPKSGLYPRIREFLRDAEMHEA